MSSRAMQIAIIGRCLATGITLAALIASAGLATPARAQTFESYGVFCAGGRITVDSRHL